MARYVALHDGRPRVVRVEEPLHNEGKGMSREPTSIRSERFGCRVENGSHQVRATLGFTLEQEELVPLRSHADNVIAAQREFASILPTEPLHGHVERQLSGDVFRCQYLSEVAGSSSLSLRKLIAENRRDRSGSQSPSPVGHALGVVVV